MAVFYIWSLISSLDQPLPDALQESVICFLLEGKHCLQDRMSREGSVGDRHCSTVSWVTRRYLGDWQLYLMLRLPWLVWEQLQRSTPMQVLQEFLQQDSQELWMLSCFFCPRSYSWLSSLFLEVCRTIKWFSSTLKSSRWHEYVFSMGCCLVRFTQVPNSLYYTEI